MQASAKNIIQNLQKDILKWEGYKPAKSSQKRKLNLHEVEKAFPDSQFPLSAIHEFVCNSTEQAVSTSAFISGILGKITRSGGVCLWIGSSPIFPHGLTHFGLKADRIVFVQLKKTKDLLWAIEEALKCTGLTAVIGEVKELDFKQSRRLQLAIEQSGVTGFIMRNQTQNKHSTACIARWQISALPSQTQNDLPGVGFLRWKVELLKVRNGQTGVWELEWFANEFRTVKPIETLSRKLMMG